MIIAEMQRTTSSSLVQDLVSLLKVDINIEESREFAEVVLQEGTAAVRNKVWIRCCASRHPFIALIPLSFYWPEIHFALSFLSYPVVKMGTLMIN